MALGDPLITDEALAEIRLAYGSHADMRLVLAELDRLREHNAYLTRLFHGIFAYFGHLCDRHAAVPIAERDLSRYEAPACEDCKDDDIRALIAGNVEATTMARGYRESGRRNIELMV